MTVDDRESHCGKTSLRGGRRTILGAGRYRSRLSLPPEFVASGEAGFGEAQCGASGEEGRGQVGLACEWIGGALGGEETSRETAPAIRTTKRRQTESLTLPTRQLRSETLALGIVLPWREADEPDGPAVGEERVAMPVKTSKADHLRCLRRCANVIRGPRNSG
ncbi:MULTISPECIES: hypothetical protein [unclassified Bosea (in: a-proteobacteria)]|uniref:hypothetical protein n=1 Tax=unclassified Bosea (in: a-proteobacteria) TaxID=2653178 RepID=UPI000F753693|nr:MULTISPECIES: hypothetical protein [unclassified Bosea (in: a-proteobacteria)]AZO80270.1 hypothetical protein BLM15_23855 [Bosea sp. Tri-49]